MRTFNWLNLIILLLRLKLDIFKPTNGILSTYNSKVCTQKYVLESTYNSKYVHFKYKRGYFSCEIINPTTVQTLEHWYLFCSWRKLMAFPLNFPCPLTQLGSLWRISLHMRIHILLFPEGFVFCLKYKVTASLTAQAVSVGGVRRLYRCRYWQLCFRSHFVTHMNLRSSCVWRFLSIGFVFSMGFPVKTLISGKYIAYCGDQKEVLVSCHKNGINENINRVWECDTFHYWSRMLFRFIVLSIPQQLPDLEYFRERDVSPIKFSFLSFLSLYFSIQKSWYFFFYHLI